MWMKKKAIAAVNKSETELHKLKMGITAAKSSLWNETFFPLFYSSFLPPTYMQSYDYDREIIKHLLSSVLPSLQFKVVAELYICAVRWRLTSSGKNGEREK